MAGDASATRRRILDAAVAEFAAYGIAGARIDRIAATAGNNKAMIYKYFGHKDALFDAVFDAIVVTTVQDVPIDADDLPGYAVRLWDQHRRHPELLRLCDWDMLERAGAGMSVEAARQARSEKVAAITDGQQRGLVNDSVAPEILLNQLIALTRTGHATKDPAAERAAIENAVRRLVAPE
jgi:AcrR family transcriptional regulator